VALAVHNDLAAQQLLTIAAQRMPNAVFVHRALGEALRRRGRRAEALARYWRALALDPGNAESYVDVAETLMGMKPLGGNDEAACACFERALQIDSACANAHAGLGHIHLRAERLEAAEASYRAAILIDEYCPAHANSLGAALYRQKRFPAAAEAYRQALTRHPRSPEIYLNLGNALRESGDPERAEQCYRHALRLRPLYPQALHQLVNLRSAGETDPAALRCYQHAIATKAGPVDWASIEVTPAPGVM
jgi:tetratricopeptide (TPR) repeat protein